MAKNSVNEWDTTDSNNEDIGGVSILGTALPSNLDNAMRKFMAQIATQFGKLNCKGADIASAATVDLAGATGNYARITGTTAIAGFGTLPGGQMFVLRFDDALTLAHDGTSLVLPGGADITTAAGDIAVVVSEGSGNWRCVGYQRAAAKPGGKATDIASASTIDLAAANGSVVDITGTTTITGLGTVAAGQVFVLQFDDILTLTHDATSLKLPGAANITTAAGDIAVVVSEEAGNWRCVSYQRAAEAPTGYRLGSRHVFTSSGTWTKPAGCRAVLVRVQAAGGAGGGSGTTANRGGAGGGAGGYTEKWITSGLGSTETVTVGPFGGAGDSSGAGNSAAASSFGAYCSATGGTGGAAPGGGFGGLGGTGIGGDINIQGGDGEPGNLYSARGGSGGSSVLGGGGSGGQVDTRGRAGGNYGGGGGGSPTTDVGAVAGEDGGRGIIIIEEFY